MPLLQIPVMTIPRWGQSSSCIWTAIFVYMAGPLRECFANMAGWAYSVTFCPDRSPMTKTVVTLKGFNCIHFLVTFSWHFYYKMSEQIRYLVSKMAVRPGSELFALSTLSNSAFSDSGFFPLGIKIWVLITFSHHLFMVTWPKTCVCKQ